MELDATEPRRMEPADTDQSHIPNIILSARVRPCLGACMLNNGTLKHFLLEYNTSRYYIIANKETCELGAA